MVNERRRCLKLTDQSPPYGQGAGAASLIFFNALHLQMNAHPYPGKGLSLSQLVFALNEELKQAVHSPS